VSPSGPRVTAAASSVSRWFSNKRKEPRNGAGRSVVVSRCQLALGSSRHLPDLILCCSRIGVRCGVGVTGPGDSCQDARVAVSLTHERMRA